jgi:hypothetical protein
LPEWFNISTNKYAAQEHQKFRPTDIQEMRTFLGIHIIMGNLHYSRIKCYWDTKHVIQISIIANNMPSNRFFKLRQNLHFVDVTNKDLTSKDRFWKIRPSGSTTKVVAREMAHPGEIRATVTLRNRGSHFNNPCERGPD